LNISDRDFSIMVPTTKSDLELDLIKLLAIGISGIKPEDEKLEDKKCSKNAEKNRKLGVKCYLKKNYSGAVSAFNQAILQAPWKWASGETPTLPWALGNRAAALQELGLLDESIANATLALQLDYPLDESHKLHFRMSKIYRALKKGGMSETSLNAAKESLKHAIGNTEMWQKLYSEGLHVLEPSRGLDQRKDYIIEYRKACISGPVEFDLMRVENGGDVNGRWAVSKEKIAGW
jgi:tetratricopeptide (TPR) repeat protein